MRSKRLSKEKHSPPPSPSMFPVGSPERSFLVHGWSNGSADYSCDKKKAWKLAGWEDDYVDDDDVVVEEDSKMPAKGADKEEGEKKQPAKEEEEDEDYDPDDNHEYRDNHSMKLLPFHDLKELVESNCCCKRCGAPVALKQETFGAATNLYLHCIPCTAGRSGSTIHESSVISERVGVDETVPDSASNYTINYLLILAMQMLGLGTETVVTFLAVLGIRSSLGKNSRWRIIQDRIGVVMEKVVAVVMDENLDREIAATLAHGITRGADGLLGLIGSLDGGWQGKGSGISYNSLSIKRVSKASYCTRY